jgi:putative nucleotidyltransferase with HDIG domain
MPELDHYLDKAKRLPTAPRLVPQLMQLLSQPNTEIGKVVDLITHDPALTTSVLRVCNSAFFAGGNPVASIQEAVTRIGFQHIYNLVVSVSAVKTLTAEEAAGVDVNELWEHSVTVAVVAQFIAKDLGDDESVAFTGGLLHDIGKLVFAMVEQNAYADLVREIEGNQSSLTLAEKKAFGFHHAEIGGRLMARWKFPSHLISCVRFHHDPSDAGNYKRFAACVYLADMIARFLGHGCGEQPLVLQRRKSVLEILDVSPERVAYYVIQTLDLVKGFQATLKIKGL